MPKLQYENEHGRYSIEIENEADYLGDTIDSLIVPILLAAGYAAESIKKFIETDAC